MSEPPGHSRWSALWAGAVNFFAALCALVVVGYLTLFGVASTFADIPLPAFVKSLTTDTTLQGVLFLATPLSAFLLALRPLMTEVSGETKTTNENLSSVPSLKQS